MNLSLNDTVILLLTFVYLSHSYTLDATKKYNREDCEDFDLERLNDISYPYPLWEEDPIFTKEQWENIKALGQMQPDKQKSEMFYRGMRLLTHFLLKNKKDTKLSGKGESDQTATPTTTVPNVHREILPTSTESFSIINNNRINEMIESTNMTISLKPDTEVTSKTMDETVSARTNDPMSSKSGEVDKYMDEAANTNDSSETVKRKELIDEANYDAFSQRSTENNYIDKTLNELISGASSSPLVPLYNDSIDETFSARTSDPMSFKLDETNKFIDVTALTYNNKQLLFESGETNRSMDETTLANTNDSTTSETGKTNDFIDGTNSFKSENDVSSQRSTENNYIYTTRNVPVSGASNEIHQFNDSFNDMVYEASRNLPNILPANSLGSVILDEPEAASDISNSSDSKVDVKYKVASKNISDISMNQSSTLQEIPLLQDIKVYHKLQLDQDRRSTTVQAQDNHLETNTISSVSPSQFNSQVDGEVTSKVPHHKFKNETISTNFSEPNSSTEEIMIYETKTENLSNQTLNISNLRYDNSSDRISIDTVSGNKYSTDTNQKITTEHNAKFITSNPNDDTEPSSSEYRSRSNNQGVQLHSPGFRTTETTISFLNAPEKVEPMVSTEQNNKILTDERSITSSSISETPVVSTPEKYKFIQLNRNEITSQISTESILSLTYGVSDSKGTVNIDQNEFDMITNNAGEHGDYGYQTDYGSLYHGSQYSSTTYSPENEAFSHDEENNSQRSTGTTKKIYNVDTTEKTIDTPQTQYSEYTTQNHDITTIDGNSKIIKDETFFSQSSTEPNLHSTSVSSVTNAKIFTSYPIIFRELSESNSIAKSEIPLSSFEWITTESNLLFSSDTSVKHKTNFEQEQFIISQGSSEKSSSFERITQPNFQSSSDASVTQNTSIEQEQYASSMIPRLNDSFEHNGLVPTETSSITENGSTEPNIQSNSLESITKTLDNQQQQSSSKETLKQVSSDRDNIKHTEMSSVSEKVTESLLRTSLIGKGSNNDSDMELSTTEDIPLHGSSDHNINEFTEASLIPEVISTESQLHSSPDASVTQNTDPSVKQISLTEISSDDIRLLVDHQASNHTHESFLEENDDETETLSIEDGISIAVSKYLSSTSSSVAYTSDNTNLEDKDKQFASNGESSNTSDDFSILGKIHTKHIVYSSTTPAGSYTDRNDHDFELFTSNDIPSDSQRLLEETNKKSHQTTVDLSSSYDNDLESSIFSTLGYVSMTQMTDVEQDQLAATEIPSEKNSIELLNQATHETTTFMVREVSSKKYSDSRISSTPGYSTHQLSLQASGNPEIPSANNLNDENDLIIDHTEVSSSSGELISDNLLIETSSMYNTHASVNISTEAPISSLEQFFLSPNNNSLDEIRSLTNDSDGSDTLSELDNNAISSETSKFMTEQSFVSSQDYITTIKINGQEELSAFVETKPYNVPTELNSMSFTLSDNDLLDQGSLEGALTSSETNRYSTGMYPEFSSNPTVGYSKTMEIGNDDNSDIVSTKTTTLSSLLSQTTIEEAAEDQYTLSSHQDASDDSTKSYSKSELFQGTNEGETDLQSSKYAPTLESSIVSSESLFSSKLFDGISGSSSDIHSTSSSRLDSVDASTEGYSISKLLIGTNETTTSDHFTPTPTLENSVGSSESRYISTLGFSEGLTENHSALLTPLKTNHTSTMSYSTPELVPGTISPFVDESYRVEESSSTKGNIDSNNILDLVKDNTTENTTEVDNFTITNTTENYYYSTESNSYTGNSHTATSVSWNIDKSNIEITATYKQESNESSESNDNNPSTTIKSTAGEDLSDTELLNEVKPSTQGVEVNSDDFNPVIFRSTTEKLYSQRIKSIEEENSTSEEISSDDPTNAASTTTEKNLNSSAATNSSSESSVPDDPATTKSTLLPLVQLVRTSEHLSRRDDITGTMSPYDYSNQIISDPDTSSGSVSDEDFITYLSPVTRHHSQNLPLPKPLKNDKRSANCAQVAEYVYSPNNRLMHANI